MALLFTVMMVIAAGNTAMQSVMPSIGSALGVDDVWISLAYTWSALLWVICAPFWARRSDQRGRKAMMALGMTGFIVSMGLCGLFLWFGLVGMLSAFWTLLLFAVARSLFGGFGSAAPPAVQAYVASRTARSERTQALSLIASSFGVGTVIGPALAPLLVFPFLGIGLTGPFITFTLVAVFALAVLKLRLPDDEPQFSARGRTFDAPYANGSGGAPADRHYDDDDDDDDEDSDQNNVSYSVGTKASTQPASGPLAQPDKLRWLDPRIRPWVIAGLGSGHAQAMVLGISGFLVLDRLGLRGTPAEGTGPVGIVLMVGALATLLAQWGLIPRFNMGPRFSTLLGTAIAGAGVVVLGAGQQLHTIAFGYAIASLGFGLTRPGTTAGTSLAVTRSEQGQASGIVASVAGASYVFAPALGVGLYNWHPEFSFTLIVAICAAVFVLGWISLQPDSELIRDKRQS